MISSNLDSHSKILHVKVKGDILSTNAEENAQGFSTILKKEAEADWDTFSLDLNSAKMIDSTGLNVLLGLVKAVQERGAKMKIHISSPAVKRVFQFSRLDMMTEINFKEKRRRR